MHLGRRDFIAGAGAAALGWACPAEARELTTLGGHAFGSYWRVAAPSGTAARPIRQQIAAIVESIDAAMSPYRADSELARFNARHSTDWVRVTPALAMVLRRALDIAGDSGGAFDPTVGPIVGRYGFGPITGARSGAHHQLVAGRGAIRKEDPGLSLDLCGIAKGYALDRINQALHRLGCDSYLVELGGEAVARGRHPSGRAWQVGIEMPGGAGLRHLVALEELAIATSGDQPLGYEFAGRRYSHIVDPHAGTPIRGALASVTVLAPTAMDADGVATAMMAMPPKVAEAFAAETAVDALLLVRGGKGLRRITTGRFVERLLV